MPSKHSFFVAAACALPLSFAACGSSNSDSPIVPEGQHYGYVVSSASVPQSSTDDFGLDLGSRGSSKLDMQHDNKLGALLVTLASNLINIHVQDTVTTAIDRGTIILLIDFQTKDLMNSSAAGFGVKIGAMPTPPACTDMSDPTCRHHLDGHGSFQIADGSPTDAVVAGKIVSGAFTGGPGDVTLQLSLGSGAPVTLNLQRARVEATISATGIMNAKVGGLLTKDEVNTSILPLIQTQANNLLTQSCAPSGQNCNCTGDAAGFLLSLDANKDCQLSLEEIGSFAQVPLSPDICTTDSCTTPDGLSIGIQVQAVKATFPDVM